MRQCFAIVSVDAWRCRLAHARASCHLRPPALVLAHARVRTRKLARSHALALALALASLPYSRGLEIARAALRPNDGESLTYELPGASGE